MDINITYNGDDYDIDIVQVIKIEFKLVQGPTYDQNVFGYVGLLFVLIGIFTIGHGKNLTGDIFMSVGLTLIYLTLLKNYSIRRVFKKRIQNLKDYRSVHQCDIIMNFNDQLFSFRSEGAYNEFHWNRFSNYLIFEEFIFLIRENNLEAAFFIKFKQMTKEQFEELRAFLATKFPVWKK